MPPQQIQPPQGNFQQTTPGQAFQDNGQVSPHPSSQELNDSRANLGFITEMHRQLIEHKAGKPLSHPQSAPQTQGEQQNQEDGEDKKLTDLESKMEQKMETMRTELKDTIKTEVESIKQSIQDAING